MPKSLVVLGFPKCGTSALMRAITQAPDVDVLRNPSGNLEMTWPSIVEIEKTRKAPPQRITAHKFTAYAYNPRALAYLAAAPPRRRFVLCVRDTRRALVSWHNMHRKIATHGKRPEHFAWKERDFYAACSLAEYYEAFARDRLAYDVHFERVVTAVRPGRLLVVSQERMAKETAAMAAACVGFGRGDWPSGNAEVPTAPGNGTHQSYADNAVIDLSDDVNAELVAVNTRLADAVETSGAHTFW